MGVNDVEFALFYWETQTAEVMEKNEDIERMFEESEKDRRSIE